MGSCYCGCGILVEDVGTGTTSVKCWNCSNTIYNLHEQNPSRELKPNQYYLIVAKNGFVLLTKFKPEANIISDWKDIIFTGIIDRAKQSISYEISGNLYKEKISTIPISKPYYKKLAFDFQNLKNYGYLNNVQVERNGGKVR